MSSLYEYFKVNSACPVCGGTKDCRQNRGSGIVHCRGKLGRVLPAARWRFVGHDRSGFAMYVDSTSPPRTRTATATPAGTYSGAASRAAKRDAAQAAKERVRRSIINAREPLSADYLDYLARTLHLPASALESYPLYQWAKPDFGDVLVYDTLDADGKRAGLKIRTLETGSKESRGSPGLIYDEAALLASDGPILCVEGLTDYLAGLSLGIASVARDFNTHGAPLTAALFDRLGLDPRRLVVMGENDRKVKIADDGSETVLWPGRDGAERVAARLAAHFQCPITISFPPAAAKDMRDWHRQLWEAHAPAWIESADDWYAVDPAWGCRETVLAHVGAAMEWVQPPAPEATQHTAAEVVYAEQADALAAEFAAMPPLPDHEPPALPVTHATDCPDAIKIWMTRKADPAAGRPHDQRLAVDAPCRRLTCPVCLQRARDHYAATIAHHLHAYAVAHGEDAPLYVFTVPRARWYAFTSSARLHAASYAAIYLVHHAEHVVVSTAWAPASITDVTSVSAAEAMQRLFVAIAQIPPQHLRVWRSSRKWKLLTDRGKPKGWNKLGKHDSDARVLDMIAEHYGCDVKYTGPIGRYWPWRGTILNLPRGADAEQIDLDVMSGEIAAIPVRVLRERAAEREREAAASAAAGGAVSLKDDIAAMFT